MLLTVDEAATLLRTTRRASLVLAQPGGIAAAITVYGAPLFYFSQAMRIAGCLAGGRISSDEDVSPYQ